MIPHPGHDALAAPPPFPPGAADAELIRLAAAGSRAAFGLLVERHQPHVFALLRRRIRCAADAEDIAQETFVRAWEKLASFDQARCFRTWVHTIASRLAIDHLRSRTAAVRREATVGRERPSFHAPAPASEPSAAAGDLPPVWASAREMLGDTAFTALWLRYVEGLETAQIGRVLGKNRVAVSMILCRARARLASHLADAAPISRDLPAPTRPRATLNPIAAAPATAAPGVSP